MSDFAEINKNKKTQEEIISTEAKINTDINTNAILINQEKQAEDIDTTSQMKTVDISEVNLGVEKKDSKSYQDEYFVVLEEIRRSLGARKRSDMADTVFKALNPVWKLLNEPMKKQDLQATKRHAGIFLNCMDLLLEKCSTYLANKHTRSSVSKKNYDEMQRLFYISSEIRQGFFDSFKSELEGENKVFNSKKETYFSFSARGMKNNIDDDDKRTDNNAAVTIASFLGLDHEQVFYSKSGANAQDNSKTLGKITADTPNHVISEEAYNQFVTMQILGILTGNMINPKDINASYTGQGDSVVIEKITGLNKPLEFTDNTDLGIDTIEFKRLDAKIIAKLKTLRDNDSFINNLDVSNGAKEAFKVRLKALLQKIRDITRDDGYQKVDIYEYKNYNKSLGWSYMNSEELINVNQVKDFASHKQQYKAMEKSFKPEKISAMQLRSGLIGNIGKEKKVREYKPSAVSRFFSKFWHKASYGLGAITYVIKKAFQGIGSLTATESALDQEEFLEDRVPGMLSTNKDKFDMAALDQQVAENGDNQEVLDDTRLVPLAYQKMIPINVDEPPYISILVKQPKPGKDSSVDILSREVGHLMLEIEYTKIDPKDHTKKRFRSRFGFHPKNGADLLDTTAMATDAVIVPGAIKDDSKHNYDVGRRFVATNKQINELVLFTQRYAKDGYNMLNRSCSTFVADAIQHVNLDDKGLVQKSRVGLGGLEFFVAVDTAIPISSTLELMSTPIVNRKQGKKTEQASYQRVGQRQISRQEYKRFFKPGNEEMMQYTPGFIGENIRAYNSENVSEIMLTQEDKYVSRTEGLDTAWITDRKHKLVEFLEKEYVDKMDRSIISDIDKNLSIFIGQIKSLEGDDVIQYDNYDKVKDERLRIEKRIQTLYQMIKYISKVYNVALDRDEAADKPIRALLNEVQNMFTSSVNTLNDYRLDINSTGKFNTMTKKSLTMDQVVVLNTFKQDEDAGSQTQMSTVELVAWLEVFGDIKTVIQRKNRYVELSNKLEFYESAKEQVENGVKSAKDDLKIYKLSSREEDELDELKSLLETVKLFENTHRNHLMSDKLTKDFAKIAFATLPKMTKRAHFSNTGATNGITQFLEGPAEAYQNIAFAKVFAGAMPDKSQFNPDNMKSYIKKFDDAADKALKEREEEFEFILHAKLSANPDIPKEDFCDDIMSSIISTYLRTELSEQFEGKLSHSPIDENNLNKYFEQQFREQKASITKIMKRVEAYYDIVHTAYLAQIYRVDFVMKLFSPDEFTKAERNAIRKELMKAIAKREEKRDSTDKRKMISKGDAIEFAQQVLKEWKKNDSDNILPKADAVDITQINLNTLKKPEPAPKKEEEKKEIPNKKEAKIEEPKKEEKKEAKVEKPKKEEKKVEKKETVKEEPKKVEIKQVINKLVEEKKESPKKAVINSTITINEPKLKTKKPSGLGFFSKHIQWSYRKRVHLNYYVEHNNYGIPESLILTSEMSEVQDAITNAKAYRLNKSQIEYLKYRLAKMKKLEDLKKDKQKAKPGVPREIHEGGIDGVMLDVEQRSFQCHSNSCWSAAMENLMRYRGVDIDQDDIRMYRPEKVKEFYPNGKHWTGEPEIERNYLFKNEPGNIFDMGDLVVDTMKNVAMSRAIFPAIIVPKKNREAKITSTAKQFSDLFLHILKECNSPIAILKGGHYRTIVGVCGDTYYYKNSLPEGVFRNYEDDPNETHHESIRDLIYSLFVSRNSTIELTWMEDIKVDADGRSHEMEQRYVEGDGKKICYNANEGKYIYEEELNPNRGKEWQKDQDRTLLSQGVVGDFKLPGKSKLNAYSKNVYMPKKLEP